MSTTARIALTVAALTALALPLPSASAQEGDLGYYREPALGGDTLVFVAEGDLWRVPATGGVARRLTTHASAERGPAISPDGSTVAFSASYEGPREIYTMPLAGGRPTRQTYGLGRGAVAGYTPDGRIVYSTSRYASLPSRQLVIRHPVTGAEERVPLAEADQGAWSDDGRTLYFTRLPFQGSNAKRYQGGTAQNLWRFETAADGVAASEATPLTADHPGTSKNPMLWNGRLYFLTDRDGTMHLWSMDPDGADRDLRQETRGGVLDIRSASLDRGRIAYRRGADIHLLDLASGDDAVVPIRLVSDADHTRTKWIKDPHRFVTSAHVSPDGKKVALTSRGRVFVAPVGKGRRYPLPLEGTTRYRDAAFSFDGEMVHLFSDATDEVELWGLPADGEGAAKQLTKGAEILRMQHAASPDGRHVAHVDKLQRLWLLNLESGEDKLVEDSVHASVDSLTWAPDGRWLVYRTAPPHVQNHNVLRLLEIATGKITGLTTDRYACSSPAFDPGGKWLFFLSDRHFRSLQPSPWGARQPEAFFDRQTRVYALALQPGLRPPFLEDDELYDRAEEAKKEKQKKPDKPAPDDPAKDDTEKDDTGPAEKPKPEEGQDEPPKEEPKPAEEPQDPPEKSAEEPAPKPDGKDGDAAKDAQKKPKPTPIEIDTDGIAQRLYELPVPAGNYSSLVAAGKHLLWLSMEDRHKPRRDLKVIQLGDPKAKVKTRMGNVSLVELSGDGKMLLVRTGNAYYVIKADAAGEPRGDALNDARVDLSGWAFAVDPLVEWRQMYDDAWRMHRDYFYDANMHGVDWDAMRERYAPLVERVRDRSDLEDLTGMLISELSALHANVGGGDHRKGTDDIGVGFLGARLARDDAAGGYRIEHIPMSDPDEPGRRSPLARQDLDVRVGDVLVAVNNRPALPSTDVGELLLNQVGRQVRLRFRRADVKEPFDVIVKPITYGADRDLRYHEWEYGRRLEAERLGAGRVGYLHLRAMGRGDMAQFTRDYYPVFNREALVIDVRRNGGGNIDAWILSRLLRKTWMYWVDRRRQPWGNMHYAPRGHLIVICDAWTASDGEAFADGFKRLGLGPVLGTRTWGGEIWLSRSNRLADNGVASAGQWGVYGLDGTWLVEGHGVDPDIVVDNLPHATFEGRDLQLERAVEVLLDKLAQEPVPVPPPPPFPDKSVEDNRKR